MYMNYAFSIFNQEFLHICQQILDALYAQIPTGVCVMRTDFRLIAFVQIPVSLYVTDWACCC